MRSTSLFPRLDQIHPGNRRSRKLRIRCASIVFFFLRYVDFRNFCQYFCEIREVLRCDLHGNDSSVLSCRSLDWKTREGLPTAFEVVSVILVWEQRSGRQAWCKDLRSHVMSLDCGGSWRVLPKDYARTCGSMALSQRAENLV